MIREAAAEAQPQHIAGNLIGKDKRNESLDHKAGRSAPAERHQIFVQHNLAPPLRGFQHPVAAQSALSGFEQPGRPLYLVQNTQEHAALPLRADKEQRRQQNARRRIAQQDRPGRSAAPQGGRAA